MRRLQAIVFFLGAIGLAMWITDHYSSTFAAQASDSAALQADTALQTALKHKDAKSAAALLDPQFSWTDGAGKTITSAQFLKDTGAGDGVNGAEYTGVKVREYGQLAVVTGTAKHGGQNDTFFARVWVKRADGWRLLTHQDTMIVAKLSASQPPSAAKDAPPPDCENPCRTVPMTPKTAAEKEVVKAYQDVETAVTSHDPKTWADHVADEFVGIGRVYTGVPDTKAGRVGQIGIVSNRVVLPKMLSGKAFVFGDAGIIIADHQPVGEPAYHVIRVWVHRDGRWQLFHRQETTIQGRE